MRAMKITICKAFALYLYMAALAACAPSTKAEEDQTANPKANETLTRVTSIAAQIKKFEYLIHTNGKVKALKERVMTADIAGRIAVCRAENGKETESGFVILIFDPTPTQHRLQKAELTLFNAEKEYQSQLLGYENLLKNKSPEEADAIRQKLRIGSGLALAEHEVKEANYELLKTSVAAPFRGVLADVKVQEGQQTAAGNELFKIYDPTSLLLEVKVLESDIALLKKGMPAEIASLSDPEKMNKASVWEINPYVDENGLVMVRLKIQQAPSGPPLFPGMNCTAVIKVPSSNSLVTPKEAVVMRSGKAVVFVLENGKAKWNYVALGRDNGKEVEIKEGLKQGQKVIITNNLQLAHDAPVRENESAESASQ